MLACPNQACRLDRLCRPIEHLLRCARTLDDYPGGFAGLPQENLT